MALRTASPRRAGRTKTSKCPAGGGAVFVAGSPNMSDNGLEPQARFLDFAAAVLLVLNGSPGNVHFADVW